ncbi:Large-conductance mechanosensitive channel [Thalassocella blandensis]|nr:Large-conductance mechanosensitive channel [Thalassocella blandensis]
MIKEFKEFAIRGNVTDMAVGIIIGAAFSKIVQSLVNDIIMPPLSVLTGDVDFSNWFITLSGKHYETLDAAQKAGAITINYGLFFSNILSFAIVAFAVFFLVRSINQLRRKEDTSSVAPTQKSCTFCYSSISIKATRCPNCTSQLQA